MSRNSHLIIRADANTRIGTGHLMRCLALAQAWKDSGGQVFFITACESDGLLQRLSDEGFQIVTVERSYPDPADWEATSQVLAAHPNAWVVLDGYHFDSAYQRQIKEAGHRLLVIDDMAHLEHYYADIVLNQNLHARQLNYSCEPYTQLLLGTRYVLLRREFLKWQSWQREIPKFARKLLVTLGGGDPNNVTLKVVRALQQVNIEDLETVVVGASNPHFRELQSVICNPQSAIRLVQNVTNMPELMAWADVAVLAAGSTCWELAFMGLPSLVIALAENQRLVAEQMDVTGIAVALGWHKNLTVDKIAQPIAGLLADLQERLKMACYSRGLVDGEGSDRILMRLEGRSLRLRTVREEDCRLLLGWANDPDVRAVSFSPEPIPWEQHVKWFKSKLNDPRCSFYIAVNSDDAPMGQIRYDAEDNKAVVSISMDRKLRGKGYGSRLIGLASRRLFGVSNVDTINAYVKQGNEASVGSFVKAGFREMGTKMMHGHQAAHLILRRKEVT